jgi:hypothetical protein
MTQIALDLDVAEILLGFRHSSLDADHAQI